MPYSRAIRCDKSKFFSFHQHPVPVSKSRKKSEAKTGIYKNPNQDVSTFILIKGFELLKLDDIRKFEVEIHLPGPDFWAKIRCSEIYNVVMTRTLTRYLRNASVWLKIKRLKSKLYLKHGIWSTLRIDGGPDNNVGRGEVRWQNRAGDCQLQADGIENRRIGWPVRHVRF